MLRNSVESEKGFTSSLISAIGAMDHVPTEEEIENTAKALAGLIGYNGDLEGPFLHAKISVTSQMGAGVSLVDIEADHDQEWANKKKDDVDWVYSNAYEKYLRAQGFPPNVVTSLSDVSLKVLGHLQDPSSEGKWDRRGMVIGHVQSGKTANYLGLIARAADAKYKFIVVIAGIHNNLRQQTQSRVDDGFVGRSSDPAESKKPIGVAQFHDGNYPHPATLTNIYNDFNRSTANQSGWQLNDFSKPIILVIKKNVNTLQSLFNWLKEMNAKRGDKITDVPMLLIDDEADNASINTNRPELDPTKTNLLIRKILGLFDKSCYVGYTATPFANIFINPEAYDEDAESELFPRDFIYCLDAPTTYYGPDKVFGEDHFEFDPVIEISDAEEYLPFSHKKHHEIPDLPASMYQAIDQFIVARAIRNHRKQTNKHCSMMINASRFVAVQKMIRDYVSQYVKEMRQSVLANYQLPEKESGADQYMQRLKAAFQEHYSDCGCTWKDVKQQLNGMFDQLGVFVINSNSDETLDYQKYEKEGAGLTAIAIGGLSLSRGLTVEGLTISYMYRNTKMYDTLMQMGRWFGYRPGYEDLCRVYLSRDSIDWYGHISEASEELRQQVKRMRRDGLSPRNFGLYVRSHPDSLMITARNKMLTGKSVTMQTNLSGRLLETYVLPTDPDVHARNKDLIVTSWMNEFCSSRRDRPQISSTNKGYEVKDVDTTVIEELLREFEVHSFFSETKKMAIDYLQRISGEYPKSDILLISMTDKVKDGDKFKLGSQERNTCILRGDAVYFSKNRVASRGDEKHGLSKEQIRKADQLAGGEKQASDVHFREVRKKPLLMLHSLDIKARIEGKEDQLQAFEDFPAFSISFPPGNYDTTVEVVANRVWMSQLTLFDDNSPEDEDYDD